MKERDSTFEGMRLIAMLMIIWGHCMMATAKDQLPYLGTLDCIGWGVGAFTVCAVNLFFLLTGFFLNNDGYRISTTVYNWIKTIFYSSMIYIVYCIVTQSFVTKECIGYFLPILTKKYWYMQTYVVSTLLLPFFVKGLGKLKNRQLTVMIGILVMFFSLHQTFFKVQYTLDQTQGYGFIWAYVMYIIGYWLRRNEEIIIKKSVWFYIGLYVLASVAIFCSNYFIVKWNIAGGVTSRGNFYAYNSVTVMMQSICLFCGFIKISKRNIRNKMINSLASNCLAGYLISSHPLLLYPLWTEGLPVNRYIGKPILYIIISFMLSVIVLLVSILIDKIVEKIAARLNIRKYINKVDDI